MRACNISVVNRWCPSVILLVSSGDSGVCGLDLCSGVTGLGAHWSSGTSRNSLRLRGYKDSTMSFLLLHQVSMGETQSSLKILPRLLRSGSTDNIGLGLRNERSYSHFRRTHTSGVFRRLAWARCSRGIRHALCGLFAAIHTRLTWARCSRGIRHARHGLFTGLLTHLAWAHCSRGIRHARRGFFAALLTRLAWARFSCSIGHTRRDLFTALLIRLASAHCSRRIRHAWHGLFVAFLTGLAWARCSGEGWLHRRSRR